MSEDLFGIKKSEFNESSLKMTRIHQLQQIINLCSLDKQAIFTADSGMPFNFSGKRNFEVIFECLNQLLMEAWAKLDSREQEEISNIRTLLRKSLDLCNPFKQVHDISINNSKIILDKKQYEQFIEVLILYEQKIRTLIDKHGFSTRESLDPSGAAYR